MFAVGEKIVYGGMGVCTVTDIGVPDLPGAARTCYVLKPDYVANARVYAPVAENPVQMRLLLTKEEAEKLVDSLPQITAFPAGQEKQELHNTCKSVIKSADSFLLAKLVKTLYEKKKALVAQKKNMASAEKDYFDTAERLLHGELASALGLDIDQVQDYIARRLEQTDAGMWAAVS